MQRHSTSNVMPEYNDAVATATAAFSRLTVERVPLMEAAGRVLAEPVTADRDLPPFNRAMMDGYAVRSADLTGSAKGDASTPARLTLDVVGEVRAGQSPDIRVGPGQCVAIATGAALPADVDTVIQHEWSDRGQPVTLTLGDASKPIARGNTVHPRGADAGAGDVVLDPPRRLTAHHIGIAASVGATELTVVQRPRAVLLTSGDEVRPIDAAVAPHQIRNSNAPMLLTTLLQLGSVVVRHEHIVDELDQTIDAVGRAIADADLVVTVGGVSAGEHDHFPAAFDAHRVRPLVTGAQIQPGKPIRVGRAPNGAAIVALPGNPVSALACAHLFIRPIANVMLGLPAKLPWRIVTLAEPVRANPRRRAFRPACLDSEDRAIVPTWAGSGDLVHTAATDGLLELPTQAEPVAAGTPLRFLPWCMQ